IVTTPDHPFFVLLRGWLPAGDLHLGDSVRRVDGSYGVVRAVATVRQSQGMYNLTVAQAHTFFVGQGRWLVHNTCGTFSEALAREEFASNASWKPATPNGDELLYHAYERHPSLAMNEYGAIDPQLYDIRARSNILNPASEIHNLGNGRYGAFNPSTG